VVIDKDGNISDEQRGAGGEAALRTLVSQAGMEIAPAANSASN
jgi:hypothetical protein